MKTTEQEMQLIVEATGGCWHRPQVLHSESGHIYVTDWCEKCEIKPAPSNPSPTDLNALFELAENLKMVVSLSSGDYDTYLCNVRPKQGGVDSWGATQVEETPAGALRRALVEAVKGEKP